MKKILTLFTLSTLILLNACKRQNSDEVKPAEPDGGGIIVAPGVADASPKAEKIIGASGGSLQSSDGEVAVIIPEGALKSNQTISIRRISNTNPLGKNNGYRLLPHGVEFQKPVQIIFKFKKAASPSTLGIAYQDANGVWQAVGGAVTDPQHKTITVATRHFSDWSLFDCLYMIPETGSVQPGQSIDLQLYTFDELLTPLGSGQEKPIGKPMKPAAGYIKKWTLVGPGELDSHGAAARYYAPDGLPDQTQVTVNTEVDLGIKGKFILVTQISVLYSAVRLTHDQHQENIYKSASALVQGDQITISAGDGDGLNVVINWKGGIGLHPFTEPQAQFGWIPGDGSRYLQIYTDPITHQDRASGGGITVTDMGITDGYVKGTFEISPIGKIGETSVIPSGTVRGTFQVKLVP